MNIIFLGLPACGKGTQGERLSKSLKMPNISTGQLFREEIAKKTKLGLLVEKYMPVFVPDDITNKLFEKRIKKADCKNGFILDGYPRTMEQVKFLHSITNIDLVILFDIDEKTAASRHFTRVQCSACGAIYDTISYKKPTCEKCNSKLVARPMDGDAEKVKNRIRLYAEAQKPLVSYYKKLGLLKKINAKKSKDEVEKQVKKLLGV